MTRDKLKEMDLIKRGATLLSLLALSGCVHLTPTEAYTATPSNQFGYIAGSFTRIDSGGFAFVMRNTDTGIEYTMPLGKDTSLPKNVKQEVIAIKVPPGQYKLTHWLAYGTLDKEKLIKKDVSNPYMTLPFDVLPGTVVFLGEYVAATTSNYSSTYWNIQPRRVTSNEAHDAFSRAYPAFSRNTFTCRLCTDTARLVLGQPDDASPARSQSTTGDK